MAATQPWIRWNGKLQFNLPGTPLFQVWATRLLKPLIDWTVETDRAGRLDAELAYVTGASTGTLITTIVQGDSTYSA